MVSLVIQWLSFYKDKVVLTAHRNVKQDMRDVAFVQYAYSNLKKLLLCSKITVKVPHYNGKVKKSTLKQYM